VLWEAGTRLVGISNIEQGITNIEGRFFAALRMTPHQITLAREMRGQAAKAYLVRGKQNNGFPLARE